MSHLGDLIIEHGPFADGEMFGSANHDWLNALRDELIELRAARRVELTHEVQQAFLEKLIQIREDNKAATCIEALVAALRAAGLEVVGNAPGAAPSATLPAEQPPAEGAARAERPQAISAGCDCGHDGLDPMYHLTPCPIAERWRRERATHQEDA